MNIFNISIERDVLEEMSQYILKDVNLNYHYQKIITLTDDRFLSREDGKILKKRKERSLYINECCKEFLRYLESKDILRWKIAYSVSEFVRYALFYKKTEKPPDGSVEEFLQENGLKIIGTA